MPRHFLLSTPAGLKSLQARHPAVAHQGPDGFISTEVVFLDAQAAHRLQQVLRQLFQASARVHDDLRILRKRSSHDHLADLACALLSAREWL